MGSPGASSRSSRADCTATAPGRRTPGHDPSQLPMARAGLEQLMYAWTMPDQQLNSSTRERVASMRTRMIRFAN
ncbi:hypothetical protein TYRP_012121 [Tyrophagus putrescentiae]|nr:hypothetical protein TYRP_012121 [Tyrophagus putrescentiae]